MKDYHQSADRAEKLTLASLGIVVVGQLLTWPRAHPAVVLILVACCAGLQYLARRRRQELKRQQQAFDSLLQARQQQLMGYSPPRV